jgi:hypothetical protein
VPRIDQFQCSTAVVVPVDRSVVVNVLLVVVDGSNDVPNSTGDSRTPLSCPLLPPRPMAHLNHLPTDTLHTHLHVVILHPLVHCHSGPCERRVRCRLRCRIPDYAGRNAKPDWCGATSHNGWVLVLGVSVFLAAVFLRSSQRRACTAAGGGLSCCLQQRL